MDDPFAGIVPPGAEGDGGPGRRKVVGRRRALPSGRAVAGGFLLAVAAAIVVAAVLTGTGAAATHRYLVTTRALPAGAVIEPGDVTGQSMRLSGPAAAAAFTDAGRLVGRAVAVPVGAGQLVESSFLVPAGTQDQTRPVSVAVDPTGVAGLVPGQSVDVLETSSGSASAPVTVVLRGATLISVSSSAPGAVSGPATAEVTLGVTSLDEVEALVGASHAGVLTLVAAEPSDGLGPGSATSGAAGSGPPVTGGGGGG